MTAGGTPDERWAEDRIRGDCIGAATSQVLWIPALLIGGAVFVAARLRMRHIAGR